MILTIASNGIISFLDQKKWQKRRYFDDIFEMVVKSLETTGIYWNLRNFWSNKILFFSKTVVCTKYYYSQFWSRPVKLKRLIRQFYEITRCFTVYVHSRPYFSAARLENVASFTTFLTHVVKWSYFKNVTR